MPRTKTSFKKGEGGKEPAYRIGQYAEVNNKYRRSHGKIGKIQGMADMISPKGKGYRTYTLILKDGTRAVIQSGHLKRINPLYLYLANGDFDEEAPTAELSSIDGVMHWGSLKELTGTPDSNYGHDRKLRGGALRW